MRILVITTYYKPDGGPAAPLFAMLCEGLARRGHKVTVLTSVPHYPSGRVLAEYRGYWKQQTKEEGVQVIRVALPSVERSGLAARMLQFIAYQVGTTLAGLDQHYDAVITHTPALEVWLPFAFFSVLRRKPAIYSVHDVYPDVGVKLGIFRNKAVIKLVASLEQFCLGHAARVRILSGSFTAAMRNRGIPESKLRLIYDWVETDAIKPLPRNNSFAVEHDLLNHFVVLYAGNIGFVQGLESVIEAARLLEGDQDIRFVFVGDGAVRESLAEKAEQLGLSNVQFIPYQPRERMPEIFATADVSLVTLRKGTGFGALPSKTFSILSSGRPVIASVDRGSDTWHLVERSQAGLCIQPESPVELKEAIQVLKQDKALRDEFGKNGREYVLKNHSPEYAAEAFEQLLLQVVRIAT